MEKLKCKHCGNEEYFYIKECFSGFAELEVNNEGEIDDTCNNIGAYDEFISKLTSVFYYCENCGRKVAKIPEDKRY